MSDDDRYIPGVPCWVDIGQADPAATAAFYGGLFGWTFEEVAPAGAPEPYTIAHLPGGAVAGIGGPGTNGDRQTWETYIRVWDVTETTAQVRAAGGRVLVEPTIVGPPGRMATYADPGGAVFSVWQAGRRKGADVVNEPGAVNFNQLHTRDPERARAFYGAVFGWDFVDHDMGEMTYTECQIHGKAIGGMADIRGRVPDEVPAYWMVYFGSVDTDEAVRKIKELGGQVMFGPVDIPAGRFAMVTDPDGAAFAVMQPSEQTLARAKEQGRI